MIELAGVEALVAGAPGDPEVQPVTALDEAVEVDAPGENAEGGDRTAVELRERGAIRCLSHVESLAAPGAQPPCHGQVASAGEVPHVLEDDRAAVLPRDLPEQQRCNVGSNPADPGAAETQRTVAARQLRIPARPHVTHEPWDHASAFMGRE